MSQRSEALIEPQMLRWARESTALTLGDAAHFAGIKNPDILFEAEEGKRRITFPQLKRLAEACALPLSVLYLSEPPKESELPVDFRAGESPTHQLDPSIIKVIRSARKRRDAMIDLQDDPSEVPGLPGFTTDGEITTFLAELVCVTKNNEYQRRSGEGSAALSLTKQLVEQNLPVLVFETTVASFRGCSLFDVPLSIVLLSSADSPNARRFTLVHELAHILMRQSGLCTPFESAQALERRCNEIAGNALLPNDLLRAETTNDESTENLIGRLAKRYRMSSSAVVVRMNQARLMKDDEASRLLHFYRSQWEAKRKAEKDAQKDGGGPSYYLLQTQRLGPKFTATVLSSYLDGSLSTSQAAQLLGVRVSPEAIQGLRKKAVEAYGR